MSHRDSVGTAPDGLRRHRRAPRTTAVAAMEDAERGLYATQFHPEVAHTEHGQQIIRTLPARHRGHPADVDDGQHHRRRGRARSARRSATRRVICGLSGGVDSSVVAALLHRAIGDQLTCVFVDHGMLRLDEAEQVVHDVPRHSSTSTSCTCDAEDRYLGAARRRDRSRAQAPHHRRGVLAGLLRGGRRRSRA